jgi:hypothetical protein
VAGALPLASAGDAALMVSRETAATRVLLCGFNVLDTDWPLRVSFPVFLSNVVRWLAEAGSRTRLVVARPGEVLRAPVAAETAQVELVAPDGARRVVPVSGGALSFAGADQVGVYSLQTGEATRRWAADLRDPMESDLTPRRELRLGEQQVVAGATEPRREAHLWPWLAMVALGLLLAEWHVYHRRY